MDELMKISELTSLLGVSSRTLRYYEQIGLVKSIRPQFETYRYYNEEAIERVRQICVLRKMQISIKDIQRIYESKDMSVLVETFVKNMDEIDLKIASLNELKRITNEFLQTMMLNGIEHISTLPLIYDKINDELAQKEEQEPITISKLNEIADTVAQPMDLNIIQLPFMRVISSKRKTTGESDVDGFYEWLDGQESRTDLFEQHTLFEYQDSFGQTIVVYKMLWEFEDCPYQEEVLAGGLFATGSVYADEDMESYFKRMIKSFDHNPYYQVDYQSNGDLRCNVLAESVLSVDRQRDRVNLLLPIKRRLPDVERYESCIELENITLSEVMGEERVLWEKSIPMDQLTPIMSPYYFVNQSGEAEYIPYISVRQLSTQIQVRLPFRVDLVFRMEETDTSFAYGSGEGSVRIYHGKSMFGVNMGNNSEPGLSKEAITLRQPVFDNEYSFPKRGSLLEKEYNHVTWIVGTKYLVVVINDEIRYCGTNFPYMNTDLREEGTHPIVLGGDGQGKLCFKEIKITQLKNKRKELLRGSYSMNLRRSNNQLENIHQLITMHYGENYWFNGCAKYVMEAKGEAAYDYWFFAGLTGDNFAQVYAYDHFRGDGHTDYMISDGDKTFIEKVFDACGYASTFVLGKELQSNTQMYLQTLIAYIDQGVPVIWYKPIWGVIVGYEEYGKILLYLTEDKNEPERISLEEAIQGYEGSSCYGWVFVGDKKEDKDLAQIYRDTIRNLRKVLTYKTKEYCFGAVAFKAWADEIESDRFTDMKPEEFNDWLMYKIYVCNLATNSGGCQGFLETALKLNPDLDYIKEIMLQYRKTGELWNELEALGGGFNVSLEALQDKKKAKAIADKIREFAVCMERVIAVIE